MKLRMVILSPSGDCSQVQYRNGYKVNTSRFDSTSSTSQNENIQR